MFKITLVGSICFFVVCVMLQKMFPYQAMAQDIPTPQATTAPSPKTDTNTFVDLIQRAHDHNADVYITLKYQHGGMSGMSRINEIGSDFVCVGQSYIINGGSLCFPFSAVDEIDIGPYADNR